GVTVSAAYRQREGDPGAPVRGPLTKVSRAEQNRPVAYRDHLIEEPFHLEVRIVLEAGVRTASPHLLPHSEVAGAPEPIGRGVAETGSCQGRHDRELARNSAIGRA